MNNFIKMLNRKKGITSTYRIIRMKSKHICLINMESHFILIRREKRIQVVQFQKNIYAIQL